MPKFKVRITRETTESTDIVVEADSKAAARDKALDEAWAGKVTGWSEDDYAGDPYIADPEWAQEI